MLGQELVFQKYRASKLGHLEVYGVVRVITGASNYFEEKTDEIDGFNLT